MSDDMEVKQELDCRGLNCPLPIVKTNKAMKGLASGDMLKMTATDPGSANDMVSWAKSTGNEIVKSLEENGEFVFFVKKG